MLTLLNISEEMRALAALMEESAVENDGELRGEAFTQLEAWFSDIQSDLERKVDGYCAVIRENELKASSRREEAERLLKLGATNFSLARGLKFRLQQFMEEQTGQDEERTNQGERCIAALQQEMDETTHAGCGDLIFRL